MKGYLYFVVTALFWGLNFHFAKMMLQEVGFIEAGFWRYVFGVLLLLIFTYKKLPSWSTVLENAKGLLLVGTVCLFGFNIFFFLGLKYSPAINGSLIVSLTPAFTLIFSNRILKTKIHRRELMGVLVSFVGVLYLLTKGNIFSLSEMSFSKGDILLLIAVSLFGIHNVWVKKYGGGLSDMNFTFFTTLLCLLSYVIVLPFFGVEEVSEYSATFWLAAVGIGLFGTAISYYLWNAGIKLTSANHAGIFINVVPLSAALFSVILGEALFLYHLISGIIIILGVVIIMTHRLKVK